MGTFLVFSRYYYFNAKRLNEGFTVFNERKIIGMLEGEKARQLHCLLGKNRLRDSINHFGVEHDFTVLVPKLDFLIYWY